MPVFLAVKGVRKILKNPEKSKRKSRPVEGAAFFKLSEEARLSLVFLLCL
jgi:hypothetical protein